MARTRRTSPRNRLAVKVVKFSLIGIFSACLIFLISQEIYSGVKKMKIFQVREVIISPELRFIEPYHFSGCQNRSIFDIPLKELQGHLKFYYPQMDNVRIVRRFPDAIFITAKRRDPVLMFIQNNLKIFLDREAVVIAKGNSLEGWSLPMIIGLDRLQDLRPGQCVRNSKVLTAIALIEGLQAQEKLKGMMVASIDVTNISQITVIFNEGPQVMMDSKALKEKADQLAVVLSQKDLDIKNIEYIDLRFKEPILGQKQNMKKGESPRKNI